MRSSFTSIGAALAIVLVSGSAVYAGPTASGTWSINGDNCRCGGSTTISPTHAESSGNWTDPSHNVSMPYSATADAGRVAAECTMSFSTEDWGSMGWSVSASAGVTEQVTPDWAGFVVRHNVANLASVVLDFTLEINALLGATANGSANPNTSASVSYTYQVADASGNGSRSVSSDGSSSISGQWGVVHGTYTATAQTSYTMSFTGTVGASGGKTFVPFALGEGQANADFAHTLKWLGITAIHAYDANHAEIPLPPDAYIDLIGAETGFNYRHSVEAPVAVPGLRTPGAPRASIAVAPNPVREGAQLTLQMPDAARTTPATVQVTDVRGRLVRMLWTDVPLAGTQTLRWDGRDAHGARVPRGMYTVTLTGRGFAASARVVVAR